MPSNESYATYGAFIVFGMSSYAVILGLWAEVAIFFRVLPEGATLSVYFVVAMQLANVAPFGYAALAARGRAPPLAPTIRALLAAGGLVAVAIGLCWRTTARAAGAERSVALLALIFAAGAVSTTTNVTFFPFVGRFPKQYTTALTLGQGLAGVLFGGLGIIQDAGGRRPRFGARPFFCGAVAGTYLWALLAFRRLLAAERRRGDGGGEGGGGGAGWGDREALLGGPGGGAGSAVREREDSTCPVMSDSKKYAKQDPASAEAAGGGGGGGGAERLPLRALLWLQGGLAAAGYGFVPSIATLVCASYDNAPTVVMWATVLGLAADPCGRALTSQVWIRRRARFIPLAILTGTLATALAATAALNPTPPFHSYKWGGAWPAALYASFMLTFAFGNTLVYYGLRRVPQTEEGEGEKGGDHAKEGGAGGAPGSGGGDGGDGGGGGVEQAYRRAGLATQAGASLGTALGAALALGGVFGHR